MKLNFDIEKKKVNVEADIEKIVEKGIDNHEKNWKDKFDVKHSAKKELMKIKHKQKVELENSNKTKKNWIQKIHEEKRKTKELELSEQRKLKELELEEKRKLEEIKQKKLILLIVISFILCLISICFFVAGSIIDPGLNVIGTFLFIAIGYIWLYRISKEKESERKNKKIFKKK